MSMMQKLLEINDEAVALLAECEQLRSDQKTLQEICAIRGQRIVELEADLRKAFGERDELRSEHKKLQDICADGGRRITELQAERDEYVLKVSLLEGHIKSLQADRDVAVQQAVALQADNDEVVEHAGRLQAELDAARKQLQEICTRPAEPQPVKVQGCGLLRDVSHYIEMAEVDTPDTDDAPAEHSGFEGKILCEQPEPQYTPPEGWRVLQYGEVLQPGDQWVNWEGTKQWPDILHGDGTTVSGGRYIRQIEQPQPVQTSAGSGLLRDVSHYTEAAEVDRPDTDDVPAEPKVKVKVQEGWWSQRGHGEVYVRPTSSSPDNEPKRTKGYVWSDGVRLYLDNGRHSKDGQTPHDLVKFLGKHLKATNEKADDAPAEPENCGFEGKILQEVSQPVQVQEVTLSAYVVGDTVSPGALRIVWATEEWIEQSQFGIVHAMKDVMFLDHDRFTDPEQFSLTLMLNK